MLGRISIILLAPLVLLFNPNIVSAQQTSLCADPDEFVPELTTSAQSDPSAAVQDKRSSELSAEEFITLDNGFFQATGDVRLDHPGLLMQTESLTLDREDGSFQIGEMSLKVFNTEGEESNERELLVRTIADSLTLESGVLQFKNAKFTNCPEGNYDVVLSSPDIQLDTNTGFAKAHKATLKFKNVPIMYFPVLIFPISDVRKSGFLMPKLGFDKDSGLSIHVPYYYNLAPNADATLSTNVISKRGVQLQTEFRRAGRHSDTTIEAEFLAKDRAWSGEGSREAINVESVWHNKKRLYSSLDAEWVSDDNYFSDFDDVFEDRESVYLNQSAQFSLVGTDYKASFGADKFSVSSSTITKDQLPPDQLPWMTVERDFRLTDQTRWKTIVSSHEFRHNTHPSGRRVRVESYLQHEQQLDFLFIRHKLGGEFINSRVRPENGHSAQKASVSGAHYSFDASFALDQIMSLENGGRWTLEPRIKLNFAKDKDQSHIPNFNTKLPNIYKFSHLYRDTFYAGGDRVADTKQASLGMSASYIDPANPNHLSRFHFGRVLFPNADENDADTLMLKEKYSGYFIGTEFVRTDWEFDTGILFNGEADSIQQATSSLSLQLTPKTKIRSFYQYFQDDEQITGILESKLSPFWSLKLKHATSLDESPLQESEILFQFSSCCWGANLSLKRSVDEKGVEDDSINLIFDLQAFKAN